MKKIFLFLILLLPMFASAQTIKDKENCIEIRNNNDTVIIQKEGTVVRNYFGSIYIIYNSVMNSNAIYGYLVLKPADYIGQFPNVISMYRFLSKAVDENYNVDLIYTGSNVTDIKHYIDGKLSYTIKLTYTGSLVTNVKTIY